MLLCMRAEKDPRVPVQTEPPRFVSVDEAGRLLGGITRREVYKRLAAGDLKSVKLGRRRLVTVASLDAYAQQLEQQAAA